MTGNIVARRYAKALFALGQKKGAAELTAYGSDLGKLAEVLAADPNVLKVFRNPIFGTDKKKAVAEAIINKIGVGQVVKNFVLLLADKERLANLPEIQAFYAKLQDEAQGVLRGRLTTAVKLDKKRQDDLKATLEKKSNRKLVLDYGVDPAIIGGLVLKVGDQVLDASLRAQLQMLKENIKRGE